MLPALRVAGLSAIVFAVGSCDQPTALHDHAGHTSAVAVSDARISDLLKDLRRETARFHSTQQAIKAGYEEPPPEDCVAVPGLGGMGYHWVNMGLIDPVFEPLKPEAVLYAPGPNGKPKLIALEYIVVDVGQPRPSFDGHPFDVGGAPLPIDHWTLHVWLFADNPSGMFAPFNPEVSCG